MARGHVIVAIEQLEARGESVTAAADKVTKVFNKCTGETRAPSTIKSWYDRRNKEHKNHDLAFEVLAECRALWDAENLDKSSADFVKKALRENELNDDLKEYLPRTPTDILEFLERILTVISPGHKLTP